MIAVWVGGGPCVSPVWVSDAIAPGPRPGPLWVRRRPLPAMMRSLARTYRTGKVVRRTLGLQGVPEEAGPGRGR